MYLCYYDNETQGFQCLFKSCLGPKQLHINHSTKTTSINKCKVTDGLHVLYKLTSYFNSHNNNRQHNTHDIQCI